MIYQYIAQSASNCTVNGKPSECGDIFEAILAFFLGVSLIIAVFLLFILVGLIFWVLSLVHLFSNNDVDERGVWIVLVLLVPLMQFIYFFGPRATYEKQKILRNK